MGNPRVYIDISIKEEKIGRIVCELFQNEAPKTVANFEQLIKGDTSIINGTSLHLRGNFFHRVIKTFMIQCGDIVFGSGEFTKSSDIGNGGCSIYATEEELVSDKKLKCYGNFEDENLGEFTEPFLLAMANTGSSNSNSSQFFITTGAQLHLNSKHSIFGKVIHGKFVVRTIENSRVDSDGFPEFCIKIDDCGMWDDSMDIPLYVASNNPIGGDIYEELPDDDTNFDHDDFGKAFEATNTIKEAGTLLFKTKDFINALMKYKKALKYSNEFIPEFEMDNENNLKFSEMKMKLFLNISLVYFNMKQYNDCITYATYLLELDNVPDMDQAKAYYRRGNSYVAKKRLEDALKDYRSCEEKNPTDKAAGQKIEFVESQIEAQKEKTRKNIAKFFSDDK